MMPASTTDQSIESLNKEHLPLYPHNPTASATNIGRASNSNHKSFSHLPTRPTITSQHQSIYGSCRDHNENNAPRNPSQYKKGFRRGSLPAKKCELQSILRVTTRNSSRRSSSSNVPSTSGIPKSASVEFALDMKHTTESDGEKEPRIQSEPRPKRGSFPRRLTVEEKENLYHHRPDLKTSPLPWVIRATEISQQKNQRRVIMVILYSIILIVSLVILYHLITR